MNGRQGRFLGDPIPRSKTELERLIEAEQADITRERQRQEYAEAMGIAMTSRGLDEQGRNRHAEEAERQHAIWDAEYHFTPPALPGPPRPHEGRWEG